MDAGWLAPILTASYNMAASGKSDFVPVVSGLQGQVLQENQVEASWSILTSPWSPVEALLTCASYPSSHKPAQDRKSIV